VGLKPSRGRNSFGPELGERWFGCSCEGVVTHTVRDTAAILDATHGPEPGDPYAAPPPARPYREEVGADPGRLRIGLVTAGWRGVEIHVENAAAATAAGRALEGLGHAVELSHPEKLEETEVALAYVKIVMSSTAMALESWGEKIGRELGEGAVEPMTWELAKRGREMPAHELAAGVSYMHALGRGTAAWHASGYDLLVTPTCGKPPPPLGELVSPPDDGLAGFVKAAPYGLFTLPFNMTGQPAISLPLHQSADGLPIGVQLVAPYGREDLLIRVAAQLEQAMPWRERRPEV
jgi:amidase